VFLIDLDDRDHDGYVDKDLLVNLMAVPDPRNLAGLGAFFRLDRPLDVARQLLG
jgi:hypothetical protein